CASPPRTAATSTSSPSRIKNRPAATQTIVRSPTCTVTCSCGPACAPYPTAIQPLPPGAGRCASSARPICHPRCADSPTSMSDRPRLHITPRARQLLRSQRLPHPPTVAHPPPDAIPAFPGPDLDAGLPVLGSEVSVL